MQDARKAKHILCMPPTNTEAVRLQNNSHTLTTANLKNSGISDDTHVSSSGVKHKIPDYVSERFLYFVLEFHLNQDFESLYIWRSLKSDSFWNLLCS